jgi:minor histocompatibility antigen H13
MIAKLLCDDAKPDDDLVQISKLDFPCALLSSFAAVWYLMTKNDLSNNLFGIAFTIQALSLISVDSFFAGATLLLGLFFYDIFFVFATDVMVTVATKFDAPIKLLFPRGAGQRASMLGLGDLVIPGIFLSLMLRLDHQLHCQGGDSDSFKKPYFTSCSIGYFIGIAVTLWVMYAFEHAQPALLYLVPGCLLSVLACALWRRELGMLFRFKDEPNVVDHAHTE